MYGVPMVILQDKILSALVEPALLQAPVHYGAICVACEDLRECAAGPAYRSYLALVCFEPWPAALCLPQHLRCMHVLVPGPEELTCPCRSIYACTTWHRVSGQSLVHMASTRKQGGKEIRLDTAYPTSEGAEVELPLQELLLLREQKRLQKCTLSRHAVLRGDAKRLQAPTELHFRRCNQCLRAR